MIIDTHLHLIYRDRLRYPWLADVPALDADFNLDTYQREARRLGIGAALHMEVDVAEADIAAETRMIADLAQVPESPLVGAIASCRPESADFPAYLESVIADPFVRGFRRVLHVVPDDLSEGALFRDNLQRLERTGLVFDLCVLPHQIEKAIALVDLAPNVSFVLDHCGVPDVRRDGFTAWREPVSRIAERPNVTVKLSGLPAYGREAWTLEDLRPYFAHVVEAFGFDRMVWGSDWPVCTLGGGLSTWVGATMALLADASADERQAVLQENARRLWRIEDRT